MSDDVYDMAADLSQDLKEEQRTTLETWSLRTSERLVEVLNTGVRTDGTKMPPNTKYTLNRKRKKGQGNKAGIATGKLRDSLKGNVLFDLKSDNKSRVYGAGRGGDVIKKANLLIKGDVKTTSKRVRDDKGRMTKEVKKTDIVRQVPRDYVGHDEEVVETAGFLAIDLIAAKWGFE